MTDRTASNGPHSAGRKSIPAPPRILLILSISLHVLSLSAQQIPTGRLEQEHIASAVLYHISSARIGAVVDQEKPEFSLTKDVALLFRANPCDTYLLRCETDERALLQISQFSGSGEDLWFTDIAELSSGHAVFQVPFGLSRVALRSTGKKLKGCTFGRLLGEETRREWIARITQAGSSHDMAETFVAAQGIRVQQLFKAGSSWTKELLWQDQVDSKITERLAAIMLASDWPFQLFKKEALTKQYPLSAAREELTGELLPTGRWESKLRRGYLSIRFWPQVDPRRRHSTICADVSIDGAPIDEICWQTGISNDLRALPHETSAPLKSAGGGAIGLPVELKFAVDTTRSISVDFHSAGWMHAQHALPLRSFGKIPMNPEQLLIATSAPRRIMERPGPSIRRSTALAAALTSRDGFCVNTEQRRRLSKLYNRDTRWSAIPEERESVPGVRVNKRILLPISEQILELGVDPSQHDLTVWTPLGDIDVPPVMRELRKDSSELKIVMERTGPPGSICAVELNGHLYGTVLLDEVSIASFLIPGESPPILKKKSSSCTIWQRTHLGDLDARELRRARHLNRYTRLDPRASLTFNLPAPRIPGLIQVRILTESGQTSRALALPIDVESRRIEPLLVRGEDGESDARVARFTAPVSQDEKQVVVHNPSDETLWISLLLRTPRDEEAAVDDDFGQVGKDAAKQVANILKQASDENLSDRIITLTSDLQATEAAPEEGDAGVPEEHTGTLVNGLLERSSLFMAAGNTTRAKDDLRLAASRAEALESEYVYEIWKLNDAFGAMLDYLPNVAAIEGDLSLSWEMIPIFKQELLEDATDALDAAKDFPPGIAPYGAALSIWSSVRDNPEAFSLHGLMLLHTLAVRHQDWLLAAWATKEIVARDPSAKLQLLWIKELVRASRNGQYVSNEDRLQTLAAAQMLGERYGDVVKSLTRAASALSSWESSEGFLGISHTEEMPWRPRANDKTRLLEDRLWGKEWDPRSIVTMNQNKKKLIEFDNRESVSMKVEARWWSRADPDGQTPQCSLQLKHGTGGVVKLNSPSSPLLSAPTTSEAVVLQPGINLLLAEVACTKQSSRVSAQMRIWVDQELGENTLRAEKPRESYRHLVVMKGTRQWNVLIKDKTATLDIRGPNALRVSYITPGNVPATAAVVEAKSAVGRTLTRTLSPSEPGLIQEELVVLPDEGVWQVTLRAQTEIAFLASHRTPKQTGQVSPHRVDPTVPEPEGDIVITQPIPAPVPLSLHGEIKSTDPGGTIWAGWRARTDAVDMEEADTPGRLWITGPRLGWHSRAIEDLLWWRFDTDLRIRADGSPAWVSRLDAYLQTEWGLRLRPTFNGAMQRVENEQEGTFRFRFLVEEEIELGKFFRLTPGLRIHYYAFSLDSLQGINPKTVDSTIYNSYTKHHYRGLLTRIRLKYRAFHPLLLIAGISSITNDDFNPTSPDRLDVEIDGYLAMFDLVIHLEGAFGYRFIDEWREESALRGGCGLWLGYNYWLSDEWSLFAQGGGRYVFGLDVYDAAVTISAVWSFGRGLVDEAPPWTPLRSFYETNRPLNATLER